MKKNLIVMFFAILFLIAVVVIGIGPKELYYKVFYFKNRINVNATIIVDGKEVEIDKDSIVIEGKETGNKKIKINKNNLDLSFNGSQYSLYTIDFKAGDYTYRIGIAHYNWWDVFHFDIKINVDTEKNILTYDSKGTYLEKDTFKEKEFNIQDEKEIEEINIISGGVW